MESQAVSATFTSRVRRSSRIEHGHCVSSGAQPHFTPSDGVHILIPTLQTIQKALPIEDKGAITRTPHDCNTIDNSHPVRPSRREQISAWLAPGPPVLVDDTFEMDLVILDSKIPGLQRISALAPKTKRLLQSCYVKATAPPRVLAATTDLSSLLTSSLGPFPNIESQPWWLSSTPDAYDRERHWVVMPQHLIPLAGVAAAPMTVVSRADVTDLASANDLVPGTDDVWLAEAVAEQQCVHAGNERVLSRLPDPRCVWVAPALRDALDAVTQLHSSIFVVVRDGGAFKVTHSFSGDADVASPIILRFAQALSCGVFDQLVRRFNSRERFFFDMRIEQNDVRQMVCCVPLEDKWRDVVLWVCYILT